LFILRKEVRLLTNEVSISYGYPPKKRGKYLGQKNEFEIAFYRRLSNEFLYI